LPVGYDFAGNEHLLVVGHPTGEFEVTYMAKMGGTVRVVNEVDGVSFYLSLKRASERGQ